MPTYPCEVLLKVTCLDLDTLEAHVRTVFVSATLSRAGSVRTVRVGAEALQAGVTKASKDVPLSVAAQPQLLPIAGSVWRRQNKGYVLTLE